MPTDNNYQIHAFCDIPNNIGCAMKGKQEHKKVKHSSTFSPTAWHKETALFSVQPHIQ
jgi:hypothetical protein